VNERTGPIEGFTTDRKLLNQEGTLESTLFKLAPLESPNFHNNATSLQFKHLLESHSNLLQRNRLLNVNFQCGIVNQLC
jgi:hypothetical protein